MGRNRVRGDDGAMAVFVCLLLVTVLLPLSGLALTAYTRTTVQAEMSRSADAGALAAASGIPLLDASVLPSLGLLGLPSAPLDPFTRGCQVALKAADADKEVSEAYASSSRTNPPCRAQYTPRPAFAQCVDDLVALLPPLPLPPVVVPPVTVPPLIPPVPPVTTPPVSVPGTALLARELVKALLPALVENGVKVTLAYRVAGPLDGIFPGQAPTEQVVVSSARRRFKPILPNFSATQLALLSPIEQAVVVAFRDLLKPLLQDVVDGTPGFLVTSSCKATVKDVLDDLSDALAVEEEVGADAVSCLVAEALGIRDPLSSIRSLTPCTGRVFRAQLAPNA